LKPICFYCRGKKKVPVLSLPKEAIEKARQSLPPAARLIFDSLIRGKSKEVVCPYCREEP